MRDVRIRGGVRSPRTVDLHVAFIKWRRFPSGIPIATHERLVRRNLDVIDLCGYARPPALEK